jgi:hypothetical protein
MPTSKNKVEEEGESGSTSNREEREKEQESKQNESLFDMEENKRFCGLFKYVGENESSRCVATCSKHSLFFVGAFELILIYDLIFGSDDWI